MVTPEYSFEAIGTHWVVHTERPVGAGLAARIAERVEVFDRSYSRFRPDSLISEVAEKSGAHTFPDDARELFAVYRRLYEATAGAVTPLVGRSLEYLGYDREYSLKPGTGVLAPPSWDDVMQWQDGVLTTESPQLIDFGAAGKGYLVDIIGALLENDGIHDYLIDGSGDLLHRGSDTYRIALEHPLDTSKAIGVANLSGRALCASATNRRAWGSGLHHVVDGRTGVPTADVIATWVIADSAMDADGLATGLFFAGPQAFTDFTFTYVRMFANGRADHSADFDGELFT